MTDESDVPMDLRLLDMNGKVRLCFRCGLSATNGRYMASCGFCSLHWHYDCIPMTHAPSPMRRWRCPAHVQTDLSHVTKRPQIAYLDLDDPRIAPFDGDYEVVNDVQPVFYDMRLGGVRYRVPETTICLEFGKAVKRRRLLKDVEVEVAEFLASYRTQYIESTQE